MPAKDPQTEKLLHLHTLPALVDYLVEELHWPITVDAWEDAFFEWTPDELNLKPEHEVAIRGIKQLRPLASNQPWGIFFVDFDKRQLPVVVLRRMLNGLAIKRRATGGGHQTWHARDLLFISSFGEGTTDSPREIALAHFSDESDLGDLPTLRVLGWDAADTALELQHVAATLKSKLVWPQATQSQADLDAWRAQWAGAFRLQKNQVINDAKSLALALAELAQNIRNRVNTVLGLESERGQLRLLHKAFKDNLIADLTEDGFADMYAQTITYGMFAARASRGSGALVADDAAHMVPSTNPLLRELLQDFLTAGGRAHRRDRRVDFDELGINEVVQTLRDVPMDAVLRAFNNDKPGDDPVIHFYEDFLKAYDKKLRAKRGVFYTPRPVVQFIVRSVDEILKTEFHIEDGLASTITWGEYLAQHNAVRPEQSAGSDSARAPLTLPAHCTASTPFVQILDPATGTATFLVEIIDLIHRHMKAKWRKDGCLTDSDFKPRWNVYVRDHLLPRLYGFELMMAPYAIAHMKIGLKLAETGYTFPEDGPRVQIFLTNALEPAHPLQPQLEVMAPMLAHEAASANAVKERLAATVVVGNPPYSGVSNNMFPWIDGLLKGQLPDGTKTKSYYHIDGLPLRERKVWLQDDYVKFIRYGQWRIDRNGVGVLGYVTNHGYLDNPTFRGMRQCLRSTFSRVSVVDLHGNSKKKESSLDGGRDENVFDIEQGVAIGLFRAGSSTGEINHASIYGHRQAKYETLRSSGLSFSKLSPSAPFFFFSPFDETNRAAYEPGWSLPQIVPNSSTGIATARDHFVVAFERTMLEQRVSDFCNKRISDDEIREKYFAGKGAEQYADGDTRGWKISDVRRAVSERALLSSIGPLYYRPFDVRPAIMSPSVVDWARGTFMHNISSQENLVLLGSRMAKGEPFAHCLVTRNVPEVICLSGTTSNNAFAFPLWWRAANGRIANLSGAYVRALAAALGPLSDGPVSETPSEQFDAESAIHYIYAVLHGPAYRTRYASFLRSDFPRIPMPGSRAVFEALAALGAQLVAWHLLEHEAAKRIEFVANSSENHPLPSPTPDEVGTKPAWFGADRLLSKVGEKGRALAEPTGVMLPSSNPSPSSELAAGDAGTMDTVGKVFINATSGFTNVRLAVWQHTIGGYQVLHKWLDDRRKAGRNLSDEDITHWLRVYAALEATQGLMQQVDATIEAHGGWPTEVDGQLRGGAFSLDHPPPDAATLAAERATLDQQLKAQKKAAKAAAKLTQHGAGAKSSGGGLPSTISLFGADADMDDLASANVSPDDDDATEGGSATRQASADASQSSLRIEDVTDWEMMCGIRAVLAREGTLSRDALIRHVAHEIGFARTGSNIASALDDAIRRAVRRGIAKNAAGELSLVSRNIEGYDRAFLKDHLVSVLSHTWMPKADVPTAFARVLGFARTGAAIEETVSSLMKAVIRSGAVEADGRGEAARYRRARG